MLISRSSTPPHRSLSASHSLSVGLCSRLSALSVNERMSVNVSPFDHVSALNIIVGILYNQLGPRVGSQLALFCIHCVNRVNSRNDPES